jgi:predicted metal-dependent enzyme (double-stranded beta helix superfamily)
MSHSASLPNCLQLIISKIEEAESITSNQLVQIMNQVAINSEDFASFTCFNHPVYESYGRNKIAVGKNFSVFVISWAPGDFTAIHNHGGADWGAVYFFNDTDHRLYSLNENTLKLTQKSKINADTIVSVDGSLIHAMGNFSNVPFITLHIYGSNKHKPNANDFTIIYELEKKQRQITNGSAFIDISAELCKETLPGIKTNTETILDYFNIVLPFYIKNKNQEMVDYIRRVLAKPEVYFL